VRSADLLAKTFEASRATLNELASADLGMPGLNGVELVHSVAAELPRTSIIYIAGDDVELPRSTLRKPVDVDDLLAEIVGVLIKR
jgi:FixJ family two-component response regulator